MERSHLDAGFYLAVLVHYWQDGLHAAVVHQVRFIPNKDERNPGHKNLSTSHQCMAQTVKQQ